MPHCRSNGAFYHWKLQELLVGCLDHGNALVHLGLVLGNQVVQRSTDTAAVGGAHLPQDGLDDGSNVFCNKMEAQTMPAEEKLFEMHRTYMDVQIDLVGSEGVETGEIRGFSCPDFSAEKDVGFGDCKTVASCVLTPGSFTLCLAGEPHKPGILVGEDPHLVKCFLKVRA